MQSACDSLDMGFGEGSFMPTIMASDAELDMGFGEGTTASEANLDMGFGKVHAGELELDMGFGPADSVHAGELDLDMGFGPPDASVSTASNMSDPWNEDSLGMLIAVQGMTHGKSPGITTHTAAQKWTSTFAI